MTRELIAKGSRIGLVTGVVSVAVLALACGASAAPVPTVSGLAVTQFRGSLVISSIDGKDRRALTRPRRAGDRGKDFEPTWSPDGSMVAFFRWTPRQLSLMVVTKDGSGLRRVAPLGRRHTDSHSAWSLGWSPDGSRLAYAAGVPGSNGREAIYVVALDGSGTRRIVISPRHFSLGFVGWTPDGARFMYVVSHRGSDNLITASADGTGTAKVVTEKEYAIDGVSWLADGSILYVRNCVPPSACQLALREPGSSTSQPLTQFKDCCADSQADDFLDFMQRPSSGDVVYTHRRNVYDLSLTTNTTRLVRVLPCPVKRTCGPPNDPLDDWVSLAAISPGGRVALIELEDDYECAPHYCYARRDYRLDLDTGALTRIHLATMSPAQIYLY